MPLVPTVAPDGPLIQKIREELRITRPTLARQIGCHPQTVWDVERKGIRVSVPMLARFARALRVKPGVITLPDEAVPQDEPEHAGAA